MQLPMSPVLKAFLEASGIDPNAPSQTEEAEKEAIRADKTVVPMSLDEGSNLLSSSRSSGLYVPSNLKQGELDARAEASPQFRGYDHSLELNRWKLLGGKTVNDDGVDDGSITMNDGGGDFVT